MVGSWSYVWPQEKAKGRTREKRHTYDRAVGDSLQLCYLIPTSPTWVNVCFLRSSFMSQVFGKEFGAIDALGKSSKNRWGERLLGLGLWEPHAGYGPDFRLSLCDPLTWACSESEWAPSSTVIGTYTWIHTHVHPCTGICTYILTHVNTYNHMCLGLLQQ